MNILTVPVSGGQSRLEYRFEILSTPKTPEMKPQSTSDCICSVLKYLYRFTIMTNGKGILGAIPIKNSEAAPINNPLIMNILVPCRK